MPLVQNGRIVYRESFEEQAARADRTWGKYRRVELSEKVRGYQERFTAMRAREVASAKSRLCEWEAGHPAVPASKGEQSA